MTHKIEASSIQIGGWTIYVDASGNLNFQNPNGTMVTMLAGGSLSVAGGLMGVTSISAGSLTCSGALSAQSAAISGPVSAQSAAISGPVSAQSAAINGNNVVTEGVTLWIKKNDNSTYLNATQKMGNPGADNWDSWPYWRSTGLDGDSQLSITTTDPG